MKEITVIGGGLSGLLLGIGLRQRGVPVRIFEAGNYPRHKVCGEFLSGRGRAVLDDLGLSSRLGSAGAIEARDVSFSLGGKTTAVRRLPFPALCISRWSMDSTLANVFQTLGGELFTGRRETAGAGEGIVRATGRRPQNAEGGWRLFGLKAHAGGVETGAGLEMHFTPRGYVGLCRVEGGKTNVCGLFRSQAAVPEVAREWKSWLGGEPGSELFRRMQNACWDEASFSSIAALALAPKSAMLSDEVSIGDAVTMIPPVTGNGMSMACESAAVAVGPLSDWACGALDWARTREQIASRLDRAFARRLRVAAMLQRVVVEPRFRGALFRAIRIVPSLQDAVFRLTR